MVGAIELSPTDTASQEAVVGSAQRVVVARARAPRDAVVYHCLEITSSRVYFRKMHHAIAYAPVDVDGQVGVANDVYGRTVNSFCFLFFIPQEWATAVLVCYKIRWSVCGTFDTFVQNKYKVL